MAKLFSPLVEELIPAFYTENGIVKITIPFSMNKAVNKKEISGFVMRVKAVSSTNYLFTMKTKDTNTFNIENSSWVTYTLGDEESSLLRVGQFYKF
jgi:hypothetical protein